MIHFAPTPVLNVFTHIYGPVNSRRHGHSLGINLGSVQKKCSWNCLYCQYGFSAPVTREQSQFPSVDEIYFQVIEKLRADPKIASLTFAGNSEPGLYPDLFLLLRKIKNFQISARAKWKTVVLSNGSELHRDEVVRAFDLADETWIKLDCGIEDDFHALNLPGPAAQGLGAHLSRMHKLKKLNIQTMLWACPSRPELSNSKREQLDALLNCYEILTPANIQLYSVSRKPAHRGLEPLSGDALRQFAYQISEKGIPCEYFI